MSKCPSTWHDQHCCLPEGHIRGREDSHEAESGDTWGPNMVAELRLLFHDALKELDEPRSGFRKTPEGLAGIEPYVEKLQDWFLRVKAERPSADDGESISITFAGSTHENDDGQVIVTATVTTESVEVGV